MGYFCKGRQERQDVEEKLVRKRFVALTWPAFAPFALFAVKNS